MNTNALSAAKPQPNGLRLCRSDQPQHVEMRAASGFINARDWATRCGWSRTTQPQSDIFGEYSRTLIIDYEAG